MTETLLSPSNILLFGAVVEDLGNQDASRRSARSGKIRPDRRASSRTDPGQPLTGLKLPVVIDGVTLVSGNNVWSPGRILESSVS